jgi:hypothetical protein
MARRRAGDPSQLARHALASRPDVADDEVAAACLTAARSEREPYRLDTAIEFATRGLALTADSRVRFALHIAQGEARYDRADMRAAETRSGPPTRRQRRSTSPRHRSADPDRSLQPRLAPRAQTTNAPAPGHRSSRKHASEVQPNVSDTPHSATSLIVVSVPTWHRHRL